MSVFLECLSMWNMLSCAEQVQMHKYETLKTAGFMSSWQVLKYMCIIRNSVQMKTCLVSFLIYLSNIWICM